MQNLIEEIFTAAFDGIFTRIQLFLREQIILSDIAEVHFIIAANLWVRTQNMTDQARIGAHVT